MSLSKYKNLETVINLQEELLRLQKNLFYSKMKSKNIFSKNKSNYTNLKLKRQIAQIKYKIHINILNNKKNKQI